MVDVDDVRPVPAQVVEVRSSRDRLAAMTKGKAGEVLAISVIGDSYSAGQDFYLNALTQHLAKDFGFAGPGYVGFNHGAALGGTNFKYTRSSKKYFGGDWDVSSLGQASPDSRTVTGQTGAFLEVDSKETASINTAITDAKLLYLGNGKTSEMRYRWTPSDTWQPLTLAGSGVQEVQLSIPANAEWSLRKV